MDYVKNIQNSGLTIYDPIELGNKSLWIPISKLETILNDGLYGFSTSGLPNRTRSKVIKQQICELLGYPIPKSFKKTQPRFLGQNFDIYVQKSNNLQIWNEGISDDRRYVLIQISNKDQIQSVKVVTGHILAQLDKTGTLTQKYQARLNVSNEFSKLISPKDTENLRRALRSASIVDNQIHDKKEAYASSIKPPSAHDLIPIGLLFERLKPLIGHKFKDAGYDQERNRGAALHRLICEQLNYKQCPDDGRFPDIQHQLLEIKLQTSFTIDLGLIRPDDQNLLNLPSLNGVYLRHCDVRYALFYGATDGSEVVLTHFFLTTGEGFFNQFPQFQGNVINRKIQIPLPTDFFN